jgi:REP element-mobilizing transposase RayT
MGGVLPSKDFAQLNESTSEIINKIVASHSSNDILNYTFAFSLDSDEHDDFHHRQRIVRFKNGKMAIFTTCTSQNCSNPKCRDSIVQRTSRRIMNDVFAWNQIKGLKLFHVVASTKREMKPQTLRKKAIDLMKRNLHGFIVNHFNGNNHCHLIVACKNEMQIKNISSSFFKKSKIMLLVKDRLTVSHRWNLARYILRKGVIGFRGKAMRLYRIF